MLFVWTLCMLLVGLSRAYPQSGEDDSPDIDDELSPVKSSGCPDHTHACVPYFQCIDGEINTSGIDLIDVRSSIRSECRSPDYPTVPGICCRRPGATTTSTTPPPQTCKDGLVCVERRLCDKDGNVVTDGTGVIDVRSHAALKSCYLETDTTKLGVCCRPPVEPPLQVCSRKQICIPKDECIGGYGSNDVAIHDFTECYIDEDNYVIGVCCDPPVAIIDLCPHDSVCVPESLCQGEILNVVNSFAPYHTGGDWAVCALHGSLHSTGVCCHIPDITPDKYKGASTCGIRNYGKGRSRTKLESTNTVFGELPWQAALFFTNYTFQCGASLISRQWVITGAHCVDDHRHSDFQVRLGEWRVDTHDEPLPYVDIDISSIIVHPHFNPRNLHYDIALLKLDHPVELEYHINTVCLPTPDDYLRPGTRCIASGWGKDAFKGAFQAILKKVDLPFIDHGDCQHLLRKTRLGRHFILHESFLCAGGEKNKDTCTGDGGGPLVCKDPSTGAYFLYGITAWGIGCGQEDIPGVYTDVQFFYKWITTTMDEI